MRASTEAQGPPLRVWSRLYQGETRFDFVGRRRVWLIVSLVVFALGAVVLLALGLNLGIDFEGGDVWQVPAGDATVSEARDTLGEFGLAGATIQELESDEGRMLRVAAEPLPPEEVDAVSAALVDLTGSSFDEINLSSVGPTWGQEVTNNAVRALVVFLGLVTLYIAVRFQWKMAVPALVALAHDVLLTVAVYAFIQIEVTPATVIAVLTILGYSLYDSVVVFDKVDENSHLAAARHGVSYGSMVNLSLNQTLMRSTNTTLTALLPVGSLLLVGSWLLGAATLQEFGVALFIGLLAGAYSSLFIAAPMLAWLKEREPEYRDLKAQLEEEGGEREPALVAAAVASAEAVPEAPAAGAGDRKPRSGTTVTRSGRVIPTRPGKRPRPPGA